MKRWLVIILIMIAVVAAARFILGGPEDDWICERGVWVMHGKPTTSKPTIPCLK